MARQENYPIRAVERSYSIVEFLQRRERAGLSEIAEALEMNKSTAFNHLKTLEEREVVSADEGTYRLGLRFFQIGTSVREAKDIFRKSKAEIESLAEETGEQVNLTVEENGRGWILYQRNGQQAIKTDLNVGSSFPMHCTAAGKVMLAEMDRQRARHLLEQRGMAARTKFTITDPDELLASFEGRERGQCVLEIQERVRGVASVAAPIIRTDETGALTVQGAVSLCGPYSRLNDDEAYRHSIEKQVSDTAHILGINLSYQ
ncbi:IclR family transcriptional regulator [Natronobiforma cellulositropha]|uniref:IclR family transcriptional regulator n=1 Tax=Natronobiforma cellulositropha TaxID=1679076 RepID=UPI0021D5F853|nr:IclR family transcriptional regulator [Natronobiforma cellulositropha]